MLNNTYKIILTLLLSSTVAAADFFLFTWSPKIGFYIHNSLAFIVGFSLLYFSYTLIAKKYGNVYLHSLTMITGFAMITIHAVKLVIGMCI